MIKILLGMMITCSIFFGNTQFTDSYIDKINEIVSKDRIEAEENNDVYQEIIDKTEFKLIDDGKIITLTGVVSNTTNKAIDYLEIGYKVFDKNGDIIENSFVNELDIKPGESRKVNIYFIEGTKIDRFELKAKSSIL